MTGFCQKVLKIIFLKQITIYFKPYIFFDSLCLCHNTKKKFKPQLKSKWNKIMPKNESNKKFCTNSLKIDEKIGKNYFIETNSNSPAYRNIFYYCYVLILQTNSISQKIAYDPIKKSRPKVPPQVKKST